MPAGYSVKVYKDGYYQPPLAVAARFYNAVSAAALELVDVRKTFAEGSLPVVVAKDNLVRASTALTDEIDRVRKHNLVIEKANEFIESLDVDSL